MADDAAPSAYERDFYEWTQAQGAALRAREAGANALDYENLAEEIESLGRSERSAVASYVRHIIEHLYKLAASQNPEVKGHWLMEIGNFRNEIEDHATPAILRLVAEDLEKLHLRAARQARQAMDLHEPGITIDASRRWTLHQILDEDADPIALAAN